MDRREGDSGAPSEGDRHVQWRKLRRRNAPNKSRQWMRWHLKKAARYGFALSAGRPCRHAGRDRMPALRVLMYHRFGNTPHDPFSVSLCDLEAQLAWLAEHRRAVSLAQAEEFLTGTRMLPDGAVLLTVDDGFQSLYTGALPLLRKYHIPAVAFIPAGLIETTAVDDPDRVRDPEPRLTWKEIVALSEAGVAIGSHGWTHRSLGRMAAAEVEQEATRSRLVLEQHIGRPVSAFAYPYGTRADYNPTVAAIVRASGYTCAFTAQHEALRPTADHERYALPRIKVEGGEALWMFALLCRGGLDHWSWVDRNLWWLQARES